MLAVRFQKIVGRAAAFAEQHGDEFPFGIELRGGAERRQHVGDDPVHAHVRPTRAFAAARIGYLAQQRDHAEFFHQRRVEGDFVSAD